MFFTGLLYLLFEDTILAKDAPTKSKEVSRCGSRTIMGIQVRSLPGGISGLFTLV